MFNGIYKNPNNKRQKYRSFFFPVNSPLRLEKTGKLHFVDKCKRGGGMKTNLEIDPGEYCAKRKTFPLFFDASPHGIAGQSESIHSDFLCPRFHSGPRFAIRRFDTVARCFRTPATFLLLPPSARNRRENKRGQEVTQWRWPTYTPTIFPSVPAISSLLYDSPPFPRPPRAPQFYFLSAATRSPILIKRISRHQFRVPWSPRDINYGRQYTRRASYVCRFEYR